MLIRLIHITGVLLCTAVISLLAGIALLMLGYFMLALYCIGFTMFDVGAVLFLLIVYGLTQLKS